MLVVLAWMRRRRSRTYRAQYRFTLCGSLQVAVWSYDADNDEIQWSLGRRDSGRLPLGL